MKIFYLVLLAIGSYLFGNINFAKIISKSKHDDITKHGSGNPGTLNMLRTFGFKWAIFNMVLEICKGVVPTLVGKLVFKQWDLSQIAIYVAGVSVILGHIFPICAKFKGGKGVAAFAGFSFVALPWWIALIIFAVCFTFVAITSIGSIGTLGFVLISTIVQLIRIERTGYNWICYILLVLVMTLIMYVHRGNIKRLFAGKENPTNIRAAFKKDFKIGEKKKNDLQQPSPKQSVDDNEVSSSNEQVKVKIMSVESNQENSNANNENELNSEERE